MYIPVTFSRLFWLTAFQTNSGLCYQVSKNFPRGEALQLQLKGPVAVNEVHFRTCCVLYYLAHKVLLTLSCFETRL